MNIDDYQLEAAKTAIYPNRGSNLPYVVLGLVGEAGEIANKAKKVLRDDGGKITSAKADDLAAELGDVLWYVAMIADELGVKLSDVAATNLAKLASRQSRNQLQGSGDAR